MIAAPAALRERLKPKAARFWPRSFSRRPARANQEANGISDVPATYSVKKIGDRGFCVGVRVPQHFVRRGTKAHAIRIEAALLRILLIEFSQKIVEAGAVVGGIAQDNIEHDSQQLALVVVRDAEIGLIVQGIFFKPGVEARFFRALPAVRGTRFKLGNLIAQIGKELRFAPQARTHERVGSIGIREAFGEPQRRRPHLMRVVDGFERLRADALDIPEVKKFVCGNIQNRVRRWNGDGRAIGVLHAAATEIPADVVQEQILLERSVAHQARLILDNLRKLLR